VVGFMFDRKKKHIDIIDGTIQNKNDMDFKSWKVELNKELFSFWESITNE
jgi:hypothetical protein